MTTATRTMLTPTREGFTHLRIALQRHRSIAAEGDYLDLLTDTTVSLGAASITFPGLDPLAGDDRTLLLLADLSTGTRECEATLWMNLASMVQRSPGWQMLLNMRGVEMPEPMDAIAQFKRETA